MAQIGVHIVKKVAEKIVVDSVVDTIKNIGTSDMAKSCQEQFAKDIGIPIDTGIPVTEPTKDAPDSLPDEASEKPMKEETKVIEKTILKETNNYFFEFNQIMEDKDMSPQIRHHALNSIRSSLSELEFAAKTAQLGDLGNVLSVGNQMISAAMSYQTFAQAGATMCLSSFAGTLGMVTSAISIAQTVFGRKKSDNGLGSAIQALANLIIQGFTMVLKQINQLHDRFDQVEEILGKQHMNTIRLTFELLKQSDGIQQLILKHEETAQRQHEMVTHDLQQVMINLNSCSSLIESNINAFRCEHLDLVVTEIDYNTANKRLTQKMIHKYIATLYGYFNSVAMNGHLTGEFIQKQPIEGQIQTLNDAWDHPMSVINFYSTRKLGHPAILKVLITYITNMIDLLDTHTAYHDQILEKIQKAYCDVQTFKEWTNPIPKPDTTLKDILLDYGAKRVNKSKEVVGYYFDREMHQCFEQLQQICSKKLYDEEYDKTFSNLHANCHWMSRHRFGHTALIDHTIMIDDGSNIYNMEGEEKKRIQDAFCSIYERAFKTKENPIPEQKIELIRAYMKQSFTCKNSIITTIHHVDSGESITVPIKVDEFLPNLKLLLLTSTNSGHIVKLDIRSSKKEGWTIYTLSVVNVLSNRVVASKTYPKQMKSVFNPAIFKHKPLEELIDCVFGGCYAKGILCIMEGGEAYHSFSNFDHSFNGTLQKKYDFTFYNGGFEATFYNMVPTESNDGYLNECLKSLIMPYSTVEFGTVELIRPTEEWHEKNKQDCESNCLKYKQYQLKWQLWNTSCQVLEKVKEMNVASSSSQ
jgi:hypothetical protein